MKKGWSKGLGGCKEIEIGKEPFHLWRSGGNQKNTFFTAASD